MVSALQTPTQLSNTQVSVEIVAVVVAAAFFFVHRVPIDDGFQQRVLRREIRFEHDIVCMQRVITKIDKSSPEKKTLNITDTSRV